MTKKNFEEHLMKGIIRKVSPNRQRAISLTEDSDKRYSFLIQVIKNLPLTDDNANYFIEEVYDILIGLIRAKLFIEGYETSGNYAHEAEISYLKKTDFLEAEITTMDEIRQFRNGIKYYGRRYTKEEADNAIKFMDSILPKLKKLIKNVT